MKIKTLIAFKFFDFTLDVNYKFFLQEKRGILTSLKNEYSTIRECF